MRLYLTRMTEGDIDQHIADLVELGEDPEIDGFWDRVRIFIASCCDMRDRIRLVYWWSAQKRKYTGRGESG